MSGKITSCYIALMTTNQYANVTSNEQLPIHLLRGVKLFKDCEQCKWLCGESGYTNDLKFIYGVSSQSWGHW